VQAELVWPQELSVLERHGLRADSTVLEAGCGPGFVTLRLLEHVRDGTVTGLDLDTTMLEHARELMSGSERVRFVQTARRRPGYRRRRSTSSWRGFCSSTCRTSGRF
jgi:ubiquinone/menaquinone biosynthesis C-methylase UbiE